MAADTPRTFYFSHISEAILAAGITYGLAPQVQGAQHVRIVFDAPDEACEPAAPSPAHGMVAMAETLPADAAVKLCCILYEHHPQLTHVTLVKGAGGPSWR